MQIASRVPTRLAPPAIFAPQRPFSPLMLADRLISLAEDADRSGHRDAASTLVNLAYSVLDDGPMQ